MTDGIAWLSAPASLAHGGYGVVMSRELASEELVARITRTARGPRRGAHSLGELTGTQLHDVLEGFYGEARDGLALRHGEVGEWSFAVKYGGWYGAFGDQPPLSRGGAHIFHLEYEEENVKPVPPRFAYTHDGRPMCVFNLHLDRSWGDGEVTGDPAVAPRVEAVLKAAGLPGDGLDRRTAHRTSLEVLEGLFELSLPRREILEGTLPAVVLRTG
ncbi:DUF6461 domain-containing protein [Streptomyces sp. NPDC087512]|uniref:DUF6461 domain-containing protein n=1 Tax=unclassified Streptomyces TaxID=2593676 RepID=UPI0034435742